jgi:ABC-2 type transport system permease protein
MNHRGGWALIQYTWASWMQHRSFFFLLAFGWMVPPLIYLFVWSTAAGSGLLGGFTRREFIAYYLILILVNQLTYAQTNWTVGDLIRDGSMNTLLLRPMSPLYNALSTEIAGKVVYMLFTLPVALVLAIILKPELHTSLGHVLLFLPALLLAWALRFFWGYWLALLAFWATRADALLNLQNALLFLLGGQVAPTLLLPSWLANLALILPFRYMIAFPVEVLMGKLGQAELWIGFGFQVFWMAAAWGLYRLLWQKGLRHYAAVGG